MNKDLKNYTILQDSQKCVHLKYNRKNGYRNFFFIKTKNPIENIHALMKTFTGTKLTIKKNLHTVTRYFYTLKYTLTNKSPNYDFKKIFFTMK